MAHPKHVHSGGRRGTEAIAHKTFPDDERDFHR